MSIRAFIFNAFLMLVASVANAAATPDYDDVYNRAMKGDKQCADSLKIYATVNNSGEAADYYAFILRSSDSPFHNKEKYIAWVDDWLKTTESKAKQGDVDACLSLGRALIGDFDNLRPVNTHDDLTERGKSYLLQAAIKGDCMAQYLYAIYNQNLSDSEKELWITEASDKGLLCATVHKAKIELDKGNYDNVISLLNQVSAQNYDYIFDNRISVNELKTLATFLKNNQNYTLNGFGPLKEDKTTFYLSRDGLILACATFKGKAGLLQLDRDGNRVNHDDIPFVYDYIVPHVHEFLPLTETSLYFQVSPYIFKEPYMDAEIRVLDHSGNECYYSIYYSYGPAIEVPDDYKYDNKD